MSRVVLLMTVLRRNRFSWKHALRRQHRWNVLPCPNLVCSTVEENAVADTIPPVGTCASGGIGRRARLRAWWGVNPVEVRVLSCAFFCSIDGSSHCGFPVTLWRVAVVESIANRGGTWRSLVARLTGGQEVAGSNPVVPSLCSNDLRQIDFRFESPGYRI